jgi:hypothetical protein
MTVRNPSEIVAVMESAKRKADELREEIAAEFPDHLADEFTNACVAAGIAGSMSAEHGSSMESWVRTIGEDLENVAKSCGAVAHIAAAAKHRAHRDIELLS